jgi:hypothetical protein
MHCKVAGGKSFVFRFTIRMLERGGEVKWDFGKRGVKSGEWAKSGCSATAKAKAFNAEGAEFKA